MKKIITACLLALLLIVPAGPALANGGEGEVVFGGDFTLESGEEVDGDLVVFGGNVVLEEDSFVDGAVFVMGGNATVAGEVDDELVVFGGNIELKSTAFIGSDVVAWGGQVERAEEAIVKGNVVGGVTTGFFRAPRIGRLFRFPFIPSPVPFKAGLGLFFHAVTDVFKIVITALALMALGLLMVLFLPKQTETVAQAILAAPLPSLGVGLLTVIVAIALTALLTLTICLSPIAVLIALATTAAGFFGWIGVSLLVGQKLLEGLKAQEPTSLVAVVIGALLTSLVSALPCLSSLIILGIASLGLGGVVLTRFGTMPYPETPPSPPPPVPAESEPPAAATENNTENEESQSQ